MNLFSPSLRCEMTFKIYLLNNSPKHKIMNQKVSPDTLVNPRLPSVTFGDTVLYKASPPPKSTSLANGYQRIFNKNMESVQRFCN